MCELAGASEESAVDVVAAAIGVDRRAGEGLVDRLAAVLADTDVLLLLDSCEHVLEPIAELVDRLLVNCPKVSIIATGRERLRVSGEQVYVVPTLPTSDDDGPAVQLFVDRARSVIHDFDPDAAERATIAEIVRRLDGLPLAIELAAARLRTLDVEEVATGLDHRFQLLSTGTRTLPGDKPVWLLMLTMVATPFMQLQRLLLVQPVDGFCWSLATPEMSLSVGTTVLLMR